jgi:hypothetical protein
VIPLNVTSDLESYLIGGLFGCDLDQINERPNENGRCQFYETVWSCFERHVSTRYSGCEQKLLWITRELTSLKNNKAKASKKSKDSEKQCLKDDAIDNCECERLRKKFVSLREEYRQQRLPRKNRESDQERSEDLFWICRLKEKACWLPISYAFLSYAFLWPRGNL